MTLIVKPQYGPGARREWAVYQRSEVRGQRSEVFGAYSMTWTGAQRAVREIKASLQRLDQRLAALPPDTITQELIDNRPRQQRPMGTIRELIWKAARN